MYKKLLKNYNTIPKKKKKKGIDIIYKRNRRSGAKHTKPLNQQFLNIDFYTVIDNSKPAVWDVTLMWFGFP